MAVIGIERSVIGQAAQPRFGEQERVSPPLEEPLQPCVHRTTDRDGQEVRPLVEEGGLPTHGHRAEVSAIGKMGERFGRVYGACRIIERLLKGWKTVVVWGNRSRSCGGARSRSASWSTLSLRSMGTSLLE